MTQKPLPINVNPCRGCGASSVSEADGVNSDCHGSTSGVSKHNSHVTPNPRVVLIFWDSYFSDTPVAVTSMNEFVWSLVASGPYMKALKQYGVNNGTVAEPIVIDMQRYPAPDKLDESQLQAQLIVWLDNNPAIPKPATDEQNFVYLIVAPSTTTLSFKGKTSGFCGYHQSTKYPDTNNSTNLFWGVVSGYTQSSDGVTFVNSVAYCVGHELCEAFTNPDGEGYHSDVNNCEIGDICEADTSNNLLKFPYLGWQIEKYWSQADNACVICSWIQASSPATVTNLTRYQNHMDLFVTGVEGGVFSTYWDASRGWYYEWFRLIDSAFVDNFTIPQGAPITPLARYQDHMDLFVVGRDGAIYTTHWDANGNWDTHWYRLGDTNFGDDFTVPPGSAITVLARYPDHMDLFVVGREGAIYTTHWDINSNWDNHWYHLGDANFADGFTVLPGSPVSALARYQDHMDLFVVGREGAIYTTHWDINSNWDDHWYRLGDANFADGFTVPPGSTISALARYPDHMDLFVVGREGAIYTTHWDITSNWDTHWYRLGDANFADGFTVLPGSAITVLARYPDHMDLFVVGRDGGIYTTHWDITSNWDTHWYRLGDTNFGDDFTVPPGSTISALARYQDHMDLFVVGRDGGVYNNYWDVNSNWFNHWYRL